MNIRNRFPGDSHEVHPPQTQKAAKAEVRCLVFLRVVFESDPRAVMRSDAMTSFDRHTEPSRCTKSREDSIPILIKKIREMLAFKSADFCRSEIRVFYRMGWLSNTQAARMLKWFDRYVARQVSEKAHAKVVAVCDSAARKVGVA